MPWLVFLVFDQGRCGGTLIGKRHVLSAAHCDTPNAVIVGEHDLTKEDGETLYKVVNEEAHPKWGIEWGMKMCKYKVFM